MRQVKALMSRENDEQDTKVNISVPDHWDTCTDEQQLEYMQKHVRRLQATLVSFEGQSEVVEQEPTESEKEDTSATDAHDPELTSKDVTDKADVNGEGGTSSGESSEGESSEDVTNSDDEDSVGDVTETEDDEK